MQNHYKAASIQGDIRITVVFCARKRDFVRKEYLARKLTVGANKIN